MGKSTTADMFRALGVPVHDADEVVHAAYKGSLVPIIEEAFPGTTGDGSVDRNALASRLQGDGGAENLKRLEAIVHPVVREAEEAFRLRHSVAGTELVVLDIPLLFETGRDGSVDTVLVVTAPASVQRERALARPGMTGEKLAAILARQTSDAEKRRRADFVIDTSLGLDHARTQVEALVAALALQK